MLEIEEIKKNYKQFDNSRIERIAENDSRGLRDEVVSVLIKEIEKRDLGTHLISWIKAERRKLIEKELHELKIK